MAKPPSYELDSRPLGPLRLAVQVATLVAAAALSYFAGAWAATVLAAASAVANIATGLFRSGVEGKRVREVAPELATGVRGVREWCRVGSLVSILTEDGKYVLIWFQSYSVLSVIVVKPYVTTTKEQPKGGRLGRALHRPFSLRRSRVLGKVKLPLSYVQGTSRRVEYVKVDFAEGSVETLSTGSPEVLVRLDGLVAEASLATAFRRWSPKSLVPRLSALVSALLDGVESGLPYTTTFIGAHLGPPIAPAGSTPPPAEGVG